MNQELRNKAEEILNTCHKKATKVIASISTPNFPTAYKEQAIDAMLEFAESQREWIMINDAKSNLPSVKGDYFAANVDETVSCVWFNPEDDFDIHLFEQEYTHYQKVNVPMPPTQAKQKEV